MQTTSLAALPVQVTGSDGAPENTGTGQGIRINSSQQTKTRDTLFTTILQKGITLRSGGTGADGTGTAPAADDGKKSGEETVDVCSLLMQLTMLGAVPLTAAGAGGGETAADGTNPDAVPGVVAGLPVNADSALTGVSPLTAMLNAVPAMAQGETAVDGNPLAQTAASDAGLPGGPITTATVDTGTGQAGTVLSGIVSALQGELAQNTTVQTASATTQQGAATAVPAQTAQDASAAATANSPGTAGSVVPEAIAGDVVQASAQTAQDGRPASAVAPAAGKESSDKKSASDVSGPSPVSDTGQAITAAVLKDPEGASAGGQESAGERGLALRGKDKGDHSDAAGSTMAGISGGKFSGTLMSEKTAAEAAAAAEKALNRLGDDLRSLRSGNHEIQIVLEPESLGTLIISVVKTETGISAKIKSENKEVVAAISDQLQKLITGMENKGIHMEDVDVVYSQADQNRGFGQNGFTQSGGGSHREYSGPTSQAQSSDAPAETVYSGYYTEASGGNSTVDYTV